MNGFASMLKVFRLFCRFLYRFRRFWRSLYYAVTDGLIIVGTAAALAGIWYLCFCTGGFYG